MAGEELQRQQRRAKGVDQEEWVEYLYELLWAKRGELRWLRVV